MNKKRLYLKKGIEKNIELIILGSTITALFSLILAFAFDELFRIYTLIFIVSNLIVLFNGYFLTKFSKKYIAIFEQ